MNAIETMGTLDAPQQLHLDQPLMVSPHSRVRVIILVQESDEISEDSWHKAMGASPTFDFLKDPSEDIYTHHDGSPFHDQG